jgi:hypothetical protein
MELGEPKLILAAGQAPAHLLQHTRVWYTLRSAEPAYICTMSAAFCFIVNAAESPGGDGTGRT